MSATVRTVMVRATVLALVVAASWVVVVHAQASTSDRGGRAVTPLLSPFLSVDGTSPALFPYCTGVLTWCIGAPRAVAVEALGVGTRFGSCERWRPASGLEVVVGYGADDAIALVAARLVDLSDVDPPPLLALPGGTVLGESDLDEVGDVVGTPPHEVARSIDGQELRFRAGDRMIDEFVAVDGAAVRSGMLHGSWCGFADRGPSTPGYA